MDRGPPDARHRESARRAARVLECVEVDGRGRWAGPTPAPLLVLPPAKRMKRMKTAGAGDRLAGGAVAGVAHSGGAEKAVCGEATLLPGSAVTLSGTAVPVKKAAEAAAVDAAVSAAENGRRDPRPQARGRKKKEERRGVDDLPTATHVEVKAEDKQVKTGRGRPGKAGKGAKAEKETKGGKAHKIAADKATVKEEQKGGLAQRSQVPRGNVPAANTPGKGDAGGAAHGRASPKVGPKGGAGTGASGAVAAGGAEHSFNPVMVAAAAAACVPIAEAFCGSPTMGKVGAGNAQVGAGGRSIPAGSIGCGALKPEEVHRVGQLRATPMGGQVCLEDVNGADCGNGVVLKKEVGLAVVEQEAGERRKEDSNSKPGPGGGTGGLSAGMGNSSVDNGHVQLLAKEEVIPGEKVLEIAAAQAAALEHARVAGRKRRGDRERAIGRAKRKQRKHMQDQHRVDEEVDTASLKDKLPSSELRTSGAVTSARPLAHAPELSPRLGQSPSGSSGEKKLVQKRGRKPALSKSKASPRQLLPALSPGQLPTTAPPRESVQQPGSLAGNVHIQKPVQPAVPRPAQVPIIAPFPLPSNQHEQPPVVVTLRPGVLQKTQHPVAQQLLPRTMHQDKLSPIGHAVPPPGQKQFEELGGRPKPGPELQSRLQPPVPLPVQHGLQERGHSRPPASPSPSGPTFLPLPSSQMAAQKTMPRQIPPPLPRPPAQPQHLQHPLQSPSPLASTAPSHVLRESPSFPPPIPPPSQSIGRQSTGEHAHRSVTSPRQSSPALSYAPHSKFPSSDSGNSSLRPLLEARRPATNSFGPPPPPPPRHMGKEFEQVPPAGVGIGVGAGQTALRGVPPVSQSGPSPQLRPMNDTAHPNKRMEMPMQSSQGQLPSSSPSLMPDRREGSNPLNGKYLEPIPHLQLKHPQRENGSGFGSSLGRTGPQPIVERTQAQPLSSFPLQRQGLESVRSLPQPSNLGHPNDQQNAPHSMHHALDVSQPPSLPSWQKPSPVDGSTDGLSRQVPRLPPRGGRAHAHVQLQELRHRGIVDPPQASPQSMQEQQPQQQLQQQRHEENPEYYAKSVPEAPGYSSGLHQSHPQHSLGEAHFSITHKAQPRQSSAAPYEQSPHGHHALQPQPQPSQQQLNTPAQHSQHSHAMQHLKPGPPPPQPLRGAYAAPGVGECYGSGGARYDARASGGGSGDGRYSGAFRRGEDVGRGDGDLAASRGRAHPSGDGDGGGALGRPLELGGGLPSVATLLNVASRGGSGGTGLGRR